MAPRSEGKRPQVPKPRLPRPPQVVDKQNANSEGKHPQTVPEPRLLHSAQAITKKEVGSSSRLKPGASRSTTSRNTVDVTSNQPGPQRITTPSAIDMAQALPPTTATQDHHSQLVTTADNVKELNIYGGQFLNSSHAIVVHGGVPSERQPVKPEEIPQGRDSSLAVLDLDDVKNGDTEAQSAHQSTKSNGKTKTNSQCTQIKEYDIYYRQLLLAGRGSPMWIPGPNMALPNEYRKNGIRIGDVGIIYRSEGFSFLFNIFLSADHPVNEGRVPDDFEHLDFGQVKKDLEKTSVYGQGHYLATLRNVTGVDSSGLVFETVASEGAILIMRDGATTEDLLNHKLVEKFIAKNAQSWYTYVREERGRKVRNGDIRLVMGFDKGASWAIATSSAEEQVRFEFKTSDSDQAASRTYTWNCVGGGSGRIGPHEDEMDGLRESNDASAAEFVIKNQTFFVRTLNFNLKGEAWDDSVIHEIRSSDNSSNDSGPPSNKQPPSSSSGGQSSSGSGTSHSGQGSVNFQTAQFGLSVVQHPSNQINDLLLKKFPDAQIVITDDADWISVLNEGDVIFPSPEDLCARLLSSHKIREKDGVVTSYDDHATSDGELTVTGKRNPNTSHNAVTSGIYTSGCLYPYHEPTYDTASILHSSPQSILHRRTSEYPSPTLGIRRRTSLTSFSMNTGTQPVPSPRVPVIKNLLRRLLAFFTRRQSQQLASQSTQQAHWPPPPQVNMFRGVRTVTIVGGTFISIAVERENTATPGTQANDFDERRLLEEDIGVHRHGYAGLT